MSPGESGRASLAAAVDRRGGLSSGEGGWAALAAAVDRRAALRSAERGGRPMRLPYYPRWNSWTWRRYRERLRPSMPAVRCPGCGAVFRVPLRRREVRRMFLRSGGYPVLPCLACEEASARGEPRNPERAAR